MAPWALELLAYGLLYECLPRDKAAAARLELRPSDSEQRLYGGSEDSDGAERGASGGVAGLRQARRVMTFSAASMLQAILCFMMPRAMLCGILYSRILHCALRQFLYVS